MKFIIFTLILSFNLSLRAQDTQVAFFQFDDAPAFEEGGSYHHVALSFEGGWVHVDKTIGVTWVKEIESIGTAHKVINLAHRELPTVDLAELKERYNHRWSWVYYECANLVGDLLRIPRKPMEFKAPYWKQLSSMGIEPPKGQLGLSPDDIYQSIKNHHTEE